MPNSFAAELELNLSSEAVQLDDKLTSILQELIGVLAMQGYRFTTVTPRTHELFLLRSDGIARDLKDVFGWGLPFEAHILPPLLLELMTQGSLLRVSEGLLRSRIRISTLDDDFFVHSSFPTDEVDSVFFGPDTYRFARFVKHALKQKYNFPEKADIRKTVRVLDIGCGSGAGGIAVVRSLPKDQPFRLNLNDINKQALIYASANAHAADIDAAVLHGDFFNLPEQKYDLIVSNPPYIIDSEQRLYRDGGSLFGLELSLRIVRHALTLLAPGGHLLLYTGVAMTRASLNPLLSELAPQLGNGMYHWCYEEIDPDVFSEELERAEYADIVRIAAVGLMIERIN